MLEIIGVTLLGVLAAGTGLVLIYFAIYVAHLIWGFTLEQIARNRKTRARIE